jgi:hypothetical protein
MTTELHMRHIAIIVAGAVTIAALFTNTVIADLAPFYGALSAIIIGDKWMANRDAGKLDINSIAGIISVTVQEAKDAFVSEDKKTTSS